MSRRIPSRLPSRSASATPLDCRPQVTVGGGRRNVSATEKRDYFVVEIVSG